MKVLLVNAFCPPYAPGGAEYSMIALADRLAASGHRAVVITPDYGLRPTVPPNVEVVAVAGFEETLASREASLHSLAEIIRKPIADAIAQFWKPGDVIHLQNTNVLEAGISVQRSGCGPIILTVRDTSPLCPSGWCLMEREDGLACSNFLEQIRCAWNYCSCRIDHSTPLRRIRSQPSHWRRWVYSQRLKTMMSAVDEIITVSDGFRELLLRNGIGDETKITRIYNFPPTSIVERRSGDERRIREQLNLDSEKKVVLAVGKRSYGKGTPDLFAAAESAWSEDRRLVVISVGKGPKMPERPYWRNLAPIDQTELSLFYRIARAVVVPSRWPEPFSRVILESLAYERPVIATDVGGSGEGVLHGKTGWLVPARDEVSLKLALLRAISLADNRFAQMQSEMQELLQKRFSQKQLLESVLRVYDRALRKFSTGEKTNKTS